MLRHREVNHVEQVLQGLLRQRDVGVVVIGLGHGREFFRSQRLQGEAGFARLHGQTLVGQGNGDFTGVGQGAQNVEELAGGHGGGGNVAARANLGVRGDLHFDVGRQERYLFAVLANEDIGQNRQGVPTLDNTTHDLQRSEQSISLGFDQLHSLFILTRSGLQDAESCFQILPAGPAPVIAGPVLACGLLPVLRACFFDNVFNQKVPRQLT